MRGFVVVAVGGVVGASMRWALAEAFSGHTDNFPWATLLTNLAGCLLIGLAARSIRVGSDRWLLIVTGVLGGFTTFSTFAVETRGLLDDGRPATALAYVAASLVLGLAATAWIRPSVEVDGR